MTFTTSRISGQPTSFLGAVPGTLASFNRLSTNEKLGVLWFIYEAMGNGSVTPSSNGGGPLAVC